MDHPFVGTGRRPKMSGDFIDAMCETAVALAIAAAVCIGVISLSLNLNEARNARASAIDTAVATIPSSSAMGDAATPHFN